MRSQFLGGAYKLRSLSDQTAINVYLEPNESGNGEPGAFIGTSGLLLKTTVDTNGCRGSRSAGGALWTVFGSTVYRVSSTWTVTEVGTLTTTGGPVGMDDNGATLVIAHGGGWHAVDLETSAITYVSGSPTMGDVSFIDNYLVGAKSDGTYQWANLNSTTIDALNFASAEGSPDPVLRTLSDHRELWLFGTKSTEVAVVTSDADLPFTRTSYIEQGILAPRSAAKEDNSVFWLGQNEHGQGVVYVAEGYVPRRISTFAIEQAIATYAKPSLATAYTYQEGGHHFYVINFPEATWAYDINTQEWAQRAWRNPVNGLLSRHRGEGHAFFRGKHVVGDYIDGRLYLLDPETFTDDGDEIYRERIWTQYAGGRYAHHFHFGQLLAEMGVGLDGSPQSDWADPQAWLSWRDDGNQAWSSEHPRSLGRIGEYNNRAIWRRMGRARRRTYRLRMTAAVKCVWYGFEFDETQAAA